MQRIDAHLHLWDTTRFDYPWCQGGAFPGLPATYLLEDAIAEDESTDTSYVVIQAEMDHASDPVEETAWVQSIADSHPQGDRIEGFVAYADLSKPDIEAVLERHARHTVFRGIRQEIWWQLPSSRPDILEEDLLASPTWRQGFGALAGVDACFDLTCWHTQLKQFAEFLSEYPTIPVIIDHLGSPIAGDEEALASWLEGIKALAARPNTFMKISGLAQADPNWTPESIRPLVDQVINVFGADRCLLGSNFPVEKLVSTYRTVWDAYRVL
ncbi:MAG: amidohydrolase family protein [Roseibium sp.]|uniref:amidohydrolase family protein n=1 Tax=Roseibium sp. TaxID=1936156 RepID=UPI00260A2958|nr:amidohydrolase family protein [Roseibium sp.]MCV0428082.1 amidohydrolase family protein [Roseibium sp.]